VRIASRLASFLRRAPAATLAGAGSISAPIERWDDQWTASGQKSAWLTERRLTGRLYSGISADRLKALGTRFTDRVTRLLAAADRILLHEFDLLGSGAYTPVDPDRPVRERYTPIDWRLDPVSRLRFPGGFPHRAWNPGMRPGLADIKLPWELGRCQHWVALGQAYGLCGGAGYALEIVRQHADFLEANPIGIGVQYTCTMDVAIRAVNWALAFELIRTSPALDDDTLERAYRSLFDLGIFIERNLENTYEVTSNHFLSNVVGLYALGVVFADLPAGRRWLAEGRDWLEEEMRVQVLVDGADYESSVPYHRLVAELFLAGARLAQLEDRPLSSGYLGSLRRMIEFLLAVLRPDGLLPQIGDADDGRLHIFTDYGTWNPQDARCLCGPASFVFDEPVWLAAGGESAAWEAEWWGFDTSEPGEKGCPAESPGAVARLFPHAGIAVTRTDRAYLIVTNGRVGTNGFGNHKHNDLLGFEFHGDSEPLLVDPGSYVYTSDPDARNAFRATAAHNTLLIDDVEQNDLRHEYLFRLFETAAVEHLRFEDTPEFTEYAGNHTGYTRLPSPVVHERTFRLTKSTAGLRILDCLQGSGRHRLTWHFRLSPGVGLESAGDGAYVLIGVNGRWCFKADPALTSSVRDAWYSPSYGVRLPCYGIEFSTTGDLTRSRTFTFTLEPERRSGRAPHFVPVHSGHPGPF
jgi:hypothetical protein